MKHKTSPESQLLSAIHSSLKKIHGATLVADHIRSRIQQDAQEAWRSGSFTVIAIGKAAPAMMSGAMNALGERIRRGLLVTKADHIQADYPEHIETVEASHPVPDQSSLHAGEKLLDTVRQADAENPLLFLISGGGSALVEVLAGTHTLEDLQNLNRRVLAEGLRIDEINRLRKQISAIKAGKLLAHIPANTFVRALYISDVPGDDPAVIASGLLSSESTEDEAHLHSLEHTVLSSNEQAREIVAGTIQQAGYKPVLNAELILQDYQQAAQNIAQTLANAAHDEVHIWGGEPTVVLPEQPGRGGRNQMLALAVAQELAKLEDCCFLSFGTDGTDGNTGDAGAVVTCRTVDEAFTQGFDVSRTIKDANAGELLEAVGALINTGPTGTNVMDIMLGMRIRPKS
jgi:hydroxypyruvate reductase